jgi:hypothetical protein
MTLSAMPWSGLRVNKGMSAITGEVIGAERVGDAVLQVIEEASLTGAADLSECIYGQDLPLFIAEVIAASGMPTDSPKQRRRAYRLAYAQAGIIADAIGIEYPR